MAAPQGGGNQSDNSAAMLWWVAAIFAICGGLWFGLKKQLISGFLFIKLYEVDFLSFFSDRFFQPHYFDQLRQVIEFARSNTANITFPMLIQIGDVVGEMLRIPLVILLIILAIVVYFSNTTRSFKRAYNMMDLAKVEKSNWPQITPVVHLDLIKTDLDTGPWAMAMTPMMFCKKNRLLEEVKAQRREGMNRKQWDKIEVVLRRGDANKLFSMQLGPLYRGANYLPPHARALFAIFAARINADTAAAAKIITQLAMSSVQSKLDLSGVDELIKKHENTKLVQKVTQAHAYSSTVMAAMLLSARDDGVQASADFLWLKPLDRRLWYTLNSVGRQTPFVEVAGIFAHWVSEKEAGRKLVVPMVEEATNALELALKEVVYKADEA